MAITINRRANVNGDNLYEYDLKGLSTDTKPTQIGGQDIEDNSLFLELDTGDFYYLSGGTWVKVGEASQVDTIIIEDVISNVHYDESLGETTGDLSKSYQEYYTALSPYLQDYSNLRIKFIGNEGTSISEIQEIRTDTDFLDVSFNDSQYLGNATLYISGISGQSCLIIGSDIKNGTIQIIEV